MAVAGQDLLAELGERRAAARGSAFRRAHQGPGELAVHRAHQAPGSRVAHLHAATGGGDRAGVADVLEQLRLARAESDALAQDDAQAEAGQGFGTAHAPDYVRAR